MYPVLLEVLRGAYRKKLTQDKKQLILVSIGILEAAKRVDTLRTGSEDRMVLFVKAVTGKTMTVEVTPQDTVAVLKAEMEQKAGLPVDQQRIIFGAMELENGRTLASYNIRNNDLLQQQIRLRGGGRAMFFLNVVMPSADVIQPVVNGDTAVSEVKKLLEEENPSLKGRKYRLMVAQQAMSSSKTLRDYGITSEAVVRLDLTKKRCCVM